MPPTLSAQINATVETLRALASIESEINTAGELIVETLKNGGKILCCGNGGSAAEAAHLATELTGRYKNNRRSLPAIALSADGSLITCIGNDYGDDEIFARAIEGLAQPEDLVVAITSSGNSPNILRALQVAKERGLKSIALLGRGGGKAKGMASVDVIVPGDSGRTAQEAHLFLIHYWCELVEEAYVR